MYPVDSPAGAFHDVQFLALLHLSLALGSTLARWWFGLPGELALPAFLAIGAGLLKPFWPLYIEYQPSYGGDDADD